jgi:Uncharacterized conserved protein
MLNMNTAARLTAFVEAQEPVYSQVLLELTAGRKETHWIWFIFPQMAGLGSSAMSNRFGINSAAEARSYLVHPVLGQRLRECTRLMLSHAGTKIDSIMGYPDDLKFRSCMTLFAAAAPNEPLFEEALEVFFKGERDQRTIALLSNRPSPRR